MNDNIQQFVIAVRRKMMQDDRYAPASLESLQLLIIKLEGTKDESGKLKNKKLRKPFIQAVTGLPLINPKSRTVSTRLLTQHTVSTLIEEVTNDTTGAISDIEGFLESTTGPERAQPWKLFPWEAPNSDMPTLF